VQQPEEVLRAGVGRVPGHVLLQRLGCGGERFAALCPVRMPALGEGPEGPLGVTHVSLKLQR
jgi:hypothetical protein